jgi:hypothetical protein
MFRQAKPARQLNRGMHAAAVDNAGIRGCQMWLIRNIKQYEYNWMCYCKVCKLLRFLKIKK